MSSRVQQRFEASLKPWLDVCGLEAWFTEALDWGGLQFVPTPRCEDEHQMWCKDSVEEALGTRKCAERWGVDRTSASFWWSKCTSRYLPKRDELRLRVLEEPERGGRGWRGSEYMSGARVRVRSRRTAG